MDFTDKQIQAESWGEYAANFAASLLYSLCITNTSNNPIDCLEASIYVVDNNIEIGEDKLYELPYRLESGQSTLQNGCIFDVSYTETAELKIKEYKYVIDNTRYIVNVDNQTYTTEAYVPDLTGEKYKGDVIDFNIANIIKFSDIKDENKDKSIFETNYIQRIQVQP